MERDLSRDGVTPSPSSEPDDMMAPATPPDGQPPLVPEAEGGEMFMIPWRGPSDGYEGEAEAVEPGALDSGGFLTRGEAEARGERIAGLVSDGRRWLDVMDLLGETDGEWLYATQVPGTVADTLALRKSLMGDNPPPHIRVTIDGLRHGLE